MRKLFTLLAAVLLTTTVWAQSPQKISYQAVIRNGSNNLVTSQLVAMRISILQGTTPVYVEIQTPTSNANGLVSIEIGSVAIPELGSFASIDWSAGTYSIKTETDPTGGTNYTTIVGTSQLLSVPYALNAKTAESITGTITEIDPVFIGSQAVNISANDITNLSHLSGTNTGDQILPTLSSLGAIASNTLITGATNTKITYDAKGLVTASAAATTADIAASTNKNYVTDAQQTVIANTSNTNTGDETIATIKTKLGITTLSGSNTGDQSLSSLGAVASNTAITGATKTKITYDAKGLVTAGADATTADIAVSVNKNYVTGAQLALLTPHFIGESYGGGVVFYIYDNGLHGLIAATSDQGASRWHGGTNVVTRATADGIGAGKANTTIIIANQASVDGNDFAATFCNQYTSTVAGVVYADWYLPSKAEVNLMYQQRVLIGNFTTGDYWSSTEVSSAGAWCVNFNNTLWTNTAKSGVANIRAIRSF